MNSLVVCSGCTRHVRRNEASCPFCGVLVPEEVARRAPRPVPTTRLGRAALFAFAAASVGAAGCGGTTDDGKSTEGIADAGPEDDGAATGNGGTNAGTGGNRASTGGRASGAGGTSNGGATTASGGADQGSGGMVNGSGGRLTGAGGEVAVPVYGAPFPIDAGQTPPKDAAPPLPADGGFAALYGAVPAYGLPPPPR